MNIGNKIKKKEALYDKTLVSLPLTPIKLFVMSFNSFGNLLKLTTYGESHGVAIGGDY